MTLKAAFREVDREARLLGHAAEAYAAWDRFGGAQNFARMERTAKAYAACRARIRLLREQVLKEPATITSEAFLVLTEGI